MAYDVYTQLRIHLERRMRIFFIVLFGLGCTQQDSKNENPDPQEPESTQEPESDPEPSSAEMELIEEDRSRLWR